MLAFDLSTDTSTDYRTTATLRGTYVSADGSMTLKVVPSVFLPSVLPYRQSNYLRNLTVRHESTGVILVYRTRARVPSLALFDLQSPVRGTVEIAGIDNRGERTWSVIAQFSNDCQVLEVGHQVFTRK
jgi:hypothetical protein